MRSASVTSKENNVWATGYIYSSELLPFLEGSCKDGWLPPCLAHNIVPVMRAVSSSIPFCRFQQRSTERGFVYWTVANTWRASRFAAKRRSRSVCAAIIYTIFCFKLSTIRCLMRTLVLSIFTVPRPFVLHVNRLQVIWSAVNYKYQSQQPAHFIVWSRPSVGMAKDRAASNHAPSRLNSCCRTLESARVSRDASANVLGGKLTALIPLGNQSSSFIHNSAPTEAWAFQSVHRALCRLLSSFSYYLYILKSIFFLLSVRILKLRLFAVISSFILLRLLRRRGCTDNLFSTLHSPSSWFIFVCPTLPHLLNCQLFRRELPQPLSYTNIRTKQHNRKRENVTHIYNFFFPLPSNLDDVNCAYPVCV